MTEYVPTPEDDELEAIGSLFHRMNAAREGSAEHRMIVRQLIGLRKSSEIACLIFEEFSMKGDYRELVETLKRWGVVRSELTVA